MKRHPNHFQCCGGNDEIPPQHTQDCDRLILAKDIAWDMLSIKQQRRLLDKARRQLKETRKYQYHTQ